MVRPACSAVALGEHSICQRASQVAAIAIIDFIWLMIVAANYQPKPSGSALDLSRQQWEL